MDELELLQDLTAQLERLQKDQILTRTAFQDIYRQAEAGLVLHPEGIEAITIFAKSEDWIPA